MTTRRLVIGVMGRGESARVEDVRRAEELGERIAREGWVLLTGGRDAGVMAAANRGAKRVQGSLTLGVLPSSGGPDADVSADVDDPSVSVAATPEEVIALIQARQLLLAGWV